MAFNNSMGTVTLPASTDHSTNQYKIMSVNSSGQAARANATDLPIGVLLNKPSVAGQAATIAWSGVAKVVAGGAITAGARVKADANGAAIAATTAAQPVLGIALATAASGDVIPVLVNPIPYA